MAKLTILVAVLAIFLLVVDASIYRTTITTTEIDEDNPGQSRRCREQLQKQDLNHCEQFLRQGSRGELMFRRIRNPEHLQRCCQQLGQIEDEQCRCEGIRRMVREQQQQGEMQGEEMREMVERAQNLPAMCHMGRQRCEIRPVWV